jgi:hypothetical protein
MCLGVNLLVCGCVCTCKGVCNPAYKCRGVCIELRTGLPTLVRRSVPFRGQFLLRQVGRVGWTSAELHLTVCVREKESDFII